MQFGVCTGRFLLLVQKHNKNNTISIKITQLDVSYKTHIQFDIGWNAPSAKLSQERSEVTKCILVQVSQLI